jgi:hypothetical protein
MLFGAAWLYSQPNAQKKIDASYVWKPSREAMIALKAEASKGDGRKAALLRIMRNDGAHEGSLIFAASFSSEAAYLSAIEPPHYRDGFTVGVVRYPFRSTASRTFVVLNGNPRIVDVSNPRLLSHIDITASADFEKFWDHSLTSRCLWNQPLMYAVQPGSKVRDSTDVEVAFPIENIKDGAIIGTAHVIFEFSFPGRKLIGTWLDFIEEKKD